VRRLIAVARFVRLVDDPETAEVAIVVADVWHRRGVGSLLAEELAAHARRSGVRRFAATMESDNVPAHRLMERLTRHPQEQHVGHGVSEVVLGLAA
jgi:RimJ/RimL family protein N-acetyltransferase